MIIGVVTDIGSDNPQSTGPATRHCILGTAGHIDHGKTALIRALTGVDTDRLPEERRRGMTIELGFAELTIGDTRFGVVDVPGHERFVRTMVAGATGIDVALLVVAADDSVMPQTVEHVDILHLLGLTRAVVAVTKIDTADSTMVELVVEEVKELLAGSPLADTAICPVSSTSLTGLAELKEALLAASASIERTQSSRPFRMAVDRVFTVQGRGTVVTGSVLRGAVEPGDTLQVWPGGRTCRVRGLQAHGVGYSMLARGQRAAVNIIGLDRDRLQRGAELATPGYLQPSRMIDVRVNCLASSPRPLKSTSKVRLEAGTAEQTVRVVLLEGGSLAPGESGYAQLRSGEPITVVHGQRFIMRDDAAVRTIGGGVVLRPIAGRRRRRVTPEQSLLDRLECGDTADRTEEVLRAARFTVPTDLSLCAQAGVELDETADVLERLKREHRWGPVAGTDVHAVPAAIEELTDRLVAWLERHHRLHPELPGRPVDTVLGWLERASTHRPLARPLLDQLVEAGKVKVLGQFVCSPAFAPALSGADEKLLATLVAETRAGGFHPPSLGELSVASQAGEKRLERLATLAVAMGELVRIDGKIYLHVESERELRTAVAELIGAHGGVSVSAVREALGSSRKFVVPFLEYLDRAGFTLRKGDLRVLSEASQA